MQTKFTNLKEFDALHMRINLRETLEYDGNSGGYDPETRISTILQINGRHFHYEAIQVKGPDDTHTAVNPGLQKTLDALAALTGADECGEEFETIEVDGRTYVEFIEPFLK